MIDKATAIPALLDKLTKLAPGHCLEIRTYKRDRSVCFQRLDADTFLVVRQGFERARFTSHQAGLRKVLKTLMKQEFPRSHKVRVYDLGPCDPTERRAMKEL